MKKRLLCLFMGLILILSVMLTACSTSTDEEDEDVTDDDLGAQTITLRMVTERKVCNSDKELAEYLENECGGDKESKKYLEMVEVKKVYDAVEAAFTKETKSQYKVHVDIVFYTEEEYYDLMEETIDQYATDVKMGELCERMLKKFVDDYKALYPELNLPEEGLKKKFFECFPEFEKYKNFSSDEEETGNDEEQYQQNKDTGIKELVFPEAGENQLDIIYISGMDMYNEYIENEWIINLNDLLNNTSYGKNISKKVAGSLLNGVKNGGDTYAVPNNVQIGEYTYMLIDKKAFDELNSETVKYEVHDVLDLEHFLEDVASEYPDRLPIDADFKQCMDNFVWYWNINTNMFGEYEIDYENNFSLLGSVYGDPANVTRGKFELGFNTLFQDENYRNIYLGLKDYEFKNYFKESDDKRTDPVVTFVNGDYSIKSLEDEPIDKEKYSDSEVYIYTDENGKQYYAYVVKYPEVDEESLYGNMFAISASSNRTQACIKVLSGINTDPKLRNILQYGIEGVNYEVDEKTGVLKRIPHTVINENDEEIDYGVLYQMKIERTGNCFIAHPEEGLPKDYWENSKKQNNEAKVNPLLGFDFNVQLEESSATGLDDALWAKMLDYTAQLSARIDECADMIELEELINGFANGMPTYTEADGKSRPFNLLGFEKLTDKNYEPEASSKPDGTEKNTGESPYKLYAEWASTYAN